MRERPILFSAPMVRAILNGTKTQTRRVVKGITPDIELAMDNNPGLSLALDDDGYGGLYQAGRGAVFSIPLPRCPYGAPGSRLWVRETWAPCPDRRDPASFIYAADRVQRYDGETWKWRPSIHMPRIASRITLEITDVRVERLHEISEEDAIAEGIARGENGWYQPMSCSNARWAYKELWNQINGLGAWDANPWVWVISFHPTTPTRGVSDA